MYQDAGLSSHGGDENIRLYNVSRNEIKNDLNVTPLVASSEGTQGSDFLSQLTIQEFENLDILGWLKERESRFPVLSVVACDLLMVQASTVASESTFSVSGRVISSRRTKLTPLTVEICICLKDHLDSVEMIQNTSPLEGNMLWVEEEIHKEDIVMGLFVPLTTQ
uniref:Zinc finger BED domain-containing protein RICESLEEPER 2-like n=1 Tax=Tanacetum cinerariifolium TaxID=118510 RepID=A0A699KJS8_TANCI|nr:zinc finger BED domain-containing protein RICESLEEPER 2-like [Tanacetum cinerariifolium]